ncbi:hypothetical protein LUZ60_013759 [Juncus effusus]|nr:hypothetical protein LUZ60_013759 [Juncus effusus]
MVSSLSSTGAISFLSRLPSVSDNPSSLSGVKTPSLSFSHRISARSLTRPRLASRLGPAEDVAASESATEEARQAQISADWETARAYKKDGTIYEGKVEGFNNGGLLMRFFSLTAFVPYPLVDQVRFVRDPPRRITERAKDLVGTSIFVKVSDANEQTRSLILSEKSASFEKYSSQIEVDSTMEGIVGSFEDYGAFIHLLFPDGVYRLTGLVHISEASWDLIQDLRDILTEGEKVKVKVLGVDQEKQRISLSIKQLEADPLYSTLDKVIMQSNGAGAVFDEKMEPLPGLDSICEELLKEDGILDVQLGRQGLEKRVVSQDLELWLSNVPVKDNQFTLLARAGRQVQEVYLTTTLDQDGIKKAVQHILERVP